MKVTMIKKVLTGNKPCSKCVAAIDVLKRRGHYDKIDHEIIAQEDDPESEGMKISQQYGIRRFPFFIVEKDDGQTVVYKSVLRMIKELWSERPAALRAR